MLTTSTEVEDATSTIPTTAPIRLSDITDRRVDEVLRRLVLPKINRPKDEVAAFSSSV
ncbi:MAG TPA: hypothetical protein VGJ28_01335 [Micromonosporaceae bacterium]